MTIFSEKLQKSLSSICEIHTNFFSLGLRTPRFEKFWFCAWLVKIGRLQNALDCLQLERFSFVALYFILRFPLNSSLVFSPLKSDIIINLVIKCPSPLPAFSV